MRKFNLYTKGKFVFYTNLWYNKLTYNTTSFKRECFMRNTHTGSTKRNGGKRWQKKPARLHQKNKNSDTIPDNNQLKLIVRNL